MGSQTTLEDYLFHLIMDKNWEKLVEIYGVHHRARTHKFSDCKCTTLHVAILCYRKDDETSINLDHIKKMSASIPPHEFDNIFMNRTSYGSTILHIAAAVGWEDACEFLVLKCPRLLYERNIRKETPLFTAANYCKLEAFICLHNLIKKDDTAPAEQPREFLCRRDDGNTILHSAISGENFELAYFIMEDYERLMYSVNGKGVSPLHVLAAKPNVFKSCNTLDFHESLLYHCIFVPEWKKYKRALPEATDNSNAKYPPNYQTCANILDFIWRPIIENTKVAFGIRSRAGDIEDQRMNQNNYHGEHKHGRYVPSNYKMFVWLLKTGMKVIILIVGIFMRWDRVKKIKMKKQQHKQAITIMNRLVENQKDYNYAKDDQEPQVLHRACINSDISSNIDYLGIESASDSLNETLQTIEMEFVPHAMDMPPPTFAETVKNENLLLMAVKTGNTEMVKAILNAHPMAIKEIDADGKNALLLAVENRQINVFQHLLSLKLPEFLFYQKDRNNGNSILHLAATFREHGEPWHASSPALQMQWEIKWYKFVKDNIPQQIYAHKNNVW